MPFVKIHISSSIKLSTREKIVKEVRESERDNWAKGGMTLSKIDLGY